MRVEGEWLDVVLQELVQQAAVELDGLPGCAGLKVLLALASQR